MCAGAGGGDGGVVSGGGDGSGRGCKPFVISTHVQALALGTALAIRSSWGL